MRRKLLIPPTLFPIHRTVGGIEKRRLRAKRIHHARIVAKQVQTCQPCSPCQKNCNTGQQRNSSWMIGTWWIPRRLFIHDLRSGPEPPGRVEKSSSIDTSRTPEKRTKRILHCLSEASLQNPGLFEERREVRRTWGQGALSFGSFSLGRQRKGTEMPCRIEPNE